MLPKKNYDHFVEQIFLLQYTCLKTKKTAYKMLSEEKLYAKPKEVIGDGDEDKNYNRIQTDRRGCGWG